MKYGMLASLLMAGAAAKNGQVEDAKKYVQIVEGFLMGAIDAEGFTDIEHCIQDGTGIINDAEDAITKFQKKDLTDIIAGIKDVADIIKLIQAAMKDCSDIKADWEKLEKIALTFKSPVSFAWHVGGDIIHNGVKITQEIETAVSDYKTEQWYDFGKQCGEAAAHVFLGSPKEYMALAENPQNERMAKFFQGFFNAFGYKFDLYMLLVCVNQEDQAALFLDVAYQAFENALHDATTEDMIGDLIGTAIGVVGAYQQFEKGLPYCEQVISSDFSRVKTAMEVLENPFENLPMMTANLKKYESEIKDDVMTGAIYYKSGDYEKFGEFLGILVKVVSEKKETVKPQSWAASYPNDNRTQIAEFLQGFFKATNVGTFNLTNLLICIYEMDNAALAFYEAAELLEEAWEKKDWQEAIGGAIAVVAGVQGVEQSLPVCEAVDTKSHNWSDLNKLIAASQDKKAFKVVENNIVFNGMTITADFITAMESFKLGKYDEFGYMLGESMTAALHQEKNLFLY